MNVHSVSTPLSFFCKFTSILNNNKFAIITAIALAAITFLIFGFLGYFQIIIGLNTITQYLFFSLGILGSFATIAISCWCKSRKKSPIDHQKESLEQPHSLTGVSSYQQPSPTQAVVENNTLNISSKKDKGKLYRQIENCWKYQKAKQDLNFIEKSKDILSITTFNVGMLPAYVRKLEKIGSLFSSSKKLQLDSTDKRIEIISKKINELPERSEIICFQELFCPSATTALCQHLLDYHIVHSVGSGKPINSGLVFASLYPIKEEGIRFYQFTNLAGEDALSSKGILRVPVEIKNREAIFYTTHFQAKFGFKYTQIRQEQLEIALEIIEEDQKANPHTPIFLIGDFNITDIDIHETTNEYSNLKHIFERFHDFFLADHNLDCKRTKINPLFSHQQHSWSATDEPAGSFYDLRVNGIETVPVCNKVRYDFILLYKNEANNSVSIDSYSEFQTWAYGNHSCQHSLLSDHLPFNVQISPASLFPKEN